MWFTKNEKKVLKLLVDDAKLSDTAIANKLNISSQAIGRIRKKLEEEIIGGYTLELDLEKLGLKTVYIIDANYSSEESEKAIREKLCNCPNITSLFKLMYGTNKYRIIRICSDLEECNNCVIMKEGQIKLSNVHTIPISNVMKDNLKPLLHKAIDGLGTKTAKVKW